MILILIILVIEVFVGILYYEFKYRPQKRKATTPKWLKQPPPVPTKRTPITISEEESEKITFIGIAKYIYNKLKD